MLYHYAIFIGNEIILMGQYLHYFNNETEFNTFVKNNYGEPWASCVEGGSVEYNFPKYVDLGLPSGNLWATKNVGAETPYEIGDAFKWGETGASTSDSYVFGKTAPYSKYNPTDGLTTLMLEDDAAYANYTDVPYGYIARIPTPNEFLELQRNCTMTLDSVNHLTIFQSNINGRHLVFPGMDYGISPFSVWTSEIYTRYSEYGYAYRFCAYSESNVRYVGMETTVRITSAINVRGVLVPGTINR